LQPHDAGFLTRKCAVTISRQAGCGAHFIAEKLSAFLQAASPAEAPPWTIFDRELVEKVLEEHNLPQSMARFLREDRISEFNDIIDELFGLHPPSWILVRKTSQTILHLAELGSVILIGRGSNIITSRMEHVFHVRLLGSVKARLARMQEFDHLTKEEATKVLESEDTGRRRYVKKYFNQNIDDPLLYHLVINTDLIPFDKVARAIAIAALDWWESLAPKHAGRQLAAYVH
jgi:cytidylate kinase